MKLITIIIISVLLNSPTFAELIRPDRNISPETVIEIQLDALMNNDLPYEDAGISQTWEFAHPQNRQFTGPLENFKLMMKSDSYGLMLNHLDYNIIFVSKDSSLANYFVELTDKNGNKVGFTWMLKKVLIDGVFKDCWMTSSVSRPYPLEKSA